MVAESPLVTVVVAGQDREGSEGATLRSLAEQKRLPEIEVLRIRNGRGAGEAGAEAPTWLRVLSLPGANLPTLKAAGVRQARAGIVAILDPLEEVGPDWIDQVLTGLAEEAVGAVGGTVLPGGPATTGNVAAFLFEYGAFHPPVSAGPTRRDLPGNNVAYRRRLLVEECADILDEFGFHKPFLHDRLRSLGWTLVLRPGMQARHLSRHRLLAFSRLRYHYGRCFGASRWRRARLGTRALYALFAPAVPMILMGKQLLAALSHPVNRRTLPRAALPLLVICCAWGFGEWVGYWLGAGRSCSKFS